MPDSRDQVVDMSKLTERELLIRLYDKIDSLESDLKAQKAVSEAKDAVVEGIKERVIKLEVRLYTVAGSAVALSGIVATVINLIKILNQ